MLYNIKMIPMHDYLKCMVVHQMGRSESNLTIHLGLLWPLFKKRINNEIHNVRTNKINLI